MNSIWKKASLLLIFCTTIASCNNATSHKSEIIEIVNEAAAAQAIKAAPVQNPADVEKDIHAMMTSATKYTSCIESLAKNKKISPQEAASLMGLGSNSQVKLDRAVESDLRMIEVYDAVTDRFCS